MTKKNWALILLKLAVTVAAIAWLLLKVDFRIVLATLRAFTPASVAVAVALTFFQSLIAAIRWHFLLRYLSVPIGFTRTLQIFWIGQFATTLLPGGVAGDGVRMWVLARDGLHVSTSINSVILDRAMALAGLFLLVAASMLFADDRVAPAAVRYAFAALLVVAVAVGLGIGLWLRVFERWKNRRIVRAVIALSNDLHAVLRSPGIAAFLVALSIGGIASGLVAVFFLMRSLGVVIPLSNCLVLGSLVLLLTTLPISFGGWGIREGSMVGLFGLAGVPAAVSLSTSILIGLAVSAVSLPGILIWLQWRRVGGVSLNSQAGAP